MMALSDKIFSRDDTSLYTSWEEEDGGIVVLHIPGVCEIKMTLAKAHEISQDLARQTDYGRWNAMEKRHDESQEKHVI
jgi:hypothetical protein